MKIYFYHDIPIAENFKKWEKKEFPGHLLYGLTHFHLYGISSVFHTIPFNPYKSRLRLMIFNLTTILCCKESFDAIYAVTHRGIELLIFLRALGLYKKPIILWHHTAVIIPVSIVRRCFSHLFYKGIDKLFFFSQYLLDASLKTGKIEEKNAEIIHWGADLDFYDSLRKEQNNRQGFISTGKEHRDLITLIRSFNRTPYICNIYISKNYEPIIASQLNEALLPNVNIHYVDSSYIKLAQKVNHSFAVVISCLNYSYTVGLTTLVEALALGLPVITTDNPTFPVDVEKEGIGLKIPYGDIDGWIRAINFLSENPHKALKMGASGRILAEKQYNLELFTKEIATVMLSLKHQIHSCHRSEKTLI